MHTPNDCPLCTTTLDEYGDCPECGWYASMPVPLLSESDLDLLVINLEEVA